jgi:hypothetical protein
LPRNTGGGIQLPFRPKPMNADLGSRALSGFAQKTVIFGNTRVLWANSFLNARLRIKALYHESDFGEKYVSENRAREIFVDEGIDWGEDSLIYSFVSPGVNHEWSIGSTDIGPNLVASGSGEWDFFQNISLLNKADPNTEDEVFENLTAATFIKIGREIFDPEYDFFYGGWFELTGIKDWRFKKMPIAIKIWPIVNGEALRTGPLFFSHYFDHHLAIYIISMGKVAQGLPPQIKSLPVPDFLERTQPPGDPYGMQFAPLSIAHFFVRTSTDGLKSELNMHLEHFQLDQGFEVTSYRGKHGQPRLGIEISDAYVKRMEGLANFGSPDAFGAPLTKGFGSDD